MTKHRTIAGFVAVALLAAAATAANIRSHSPSTNRVVASAGMTLLKDLTIDVKKLPIGGFRRPVAGLFNEALNQRQTQAAVASGDSYSYLASEKTLAL